MAKNVVVIPEEIPLIVLEPQPMLFPTIKVGVFVEQHPDLINLARINLAKHSKDPSYVFLTMERLRNVEDRPSLYLTGVVAKIIGVGKDKPILGFEGLYRAKLIKLIEGAQDTTYNLAVTGNPLIDTPNKFFKDINGEYLVAKEHENIIQALLNIMRDKINNLLQMGEDLLGTKGSLLDWVDEVFDTLDLSKRDAIDTLVWQTAYCLPNLNAQEKQEFIESPSLLSRLRKCTHLLKKNITILDIQRNVDSSNPKKNRQTLITDGKKTSSGKDDDPDDKFKTDNPDLVSRWERFQEIKDKLIPDVVKAIKEDFNHLKSSQPGQADWTIHSNHLDCLLDLYSTKPSEERKDFRETEKILKASHYGMEKLKKRILDWVATRRRNPKSKGPILCFVGAPGVGKTSIAKAIADSLGREFIRLSLGALKDEAEIRGHRRTYVGAIPGKVIEEIRRKGVSNPVFLFDEIDKLGQDFKGDPSSALLEVLDPEQNHSFQDHYVGCPFNLSDVFFICTANTLEGLQPALLDRMTILSVQGYTEQEKIQIAHAHLIPKQMNEVGLTGKVNFDWQGNSILSFIISGYTRESGVRNVEKQINQLFSGLGRKYIDESVESVNPLEFQLTESVIEEFLGTRLFTNDRIQPAKVGEAVGLAWTPHGGDTLYIQSKILKFKGKELSVTGLIGKSMEESCKVALSLVREKLEEEGRNELDDKSIHIHVPEGAIEKDGPSAGITIHTSLTAAVNKTRIRPYVVMTGEITLSRLVTKIGGVKEKVLAAYRDGAKEVILPLSNKRDYDDDVSQEIKDNLKFHFVETVDEVTDIVLPQLKPTEKPERPVNGC